MKPTDLLALAALSALASFAPLACDKPDAPADKAAPSATAVAATPPPSPPSMPLPAPTASATAPAAAPTKDAVVSVLDPAKEHDRTVNALAGGTVALYLPEWAGTTWKITQSDKGLGKPKEETIPGFSGPTPAHAFTWQINDALKGVHKVPLTNTAKGRPPGGDTSFTLSINGG
jgi:hypothetical protein